MSCNCKPSPCVPQDCSCTTFLKSDCVNDVSAVFECLNIESHLTLTETLEQMDSEICALVNSINGFLTLINVGTGAGVYKGVNNIGQKELKTLTKTGDLLVITPSTNEIDITIDEAELANFVNDLIPPPVDVCVQSDTLAVTEDEGCFNVELEIVSDTLTVTQEEPGVIRVEQPTSFQGTDYYVNANYTGQEETGTATRPFKNLKRCIDVILNRAYQNESFVWVETPNPTINSGNTYNKWDYRTMPIRVRIQSFTYINENIAINAVTYLLEDGIIQIRNTNTTLERLIDMKELVDNCPKDGDNKLAYSLNCSVIGKGKLQNYSTVRKGIARAYGHFGGTINEFQNTSYLSLGDINSEIYYDFAKLSSLTYVPLYSDDANTIPIVREGVAMTGHIATSTPDYAVIEFDGENAPYRYSLFMDGIHIINAFEQQVFLGKNSALYGENGTLYLRRSYQHVNFSSIETIEGNKYYKPSEFVYDIHLKEGAFFDYGGKFYTQENTGMNQGGSEAFVCVESPSLSQRSSFNANGGGIIYRLFYNHYFKIINDSSFANRQTGRINAKNLNIESVPFINIFEVVDENDDPKTEEIYPSTITDCFFFDVFERGNIRRDFSNIALNAELYIGGNLVKIANTIMLPSIINYTDNATAVSANMPIGSFYKDDNGFIKVVE